MVLTVCLDIPSSLAVANILLPVQQPKLTDFDGQGILLEAFFFKYVLSTKKMSVKAKQTVNGHF